MFNFLKAKKEDAIYPNFSKRMLASVIDLMLVYLILTPVWHLLSLIIYAGPSPIMQLRQKIKTITENTAEKTAAIGQQQEYIEFINQSGYLPFIQEQATQLVILGIIMLWFWIKYNATPGKMLLSLKIVDAKKLQKPNIFQLVLRMLSCIISVIPLGVGFITTIFNKENRAWHDLLSGTVIVKKNAIRNNEK